ncbi:MAG: dihydropteroate synthase [Desulfobacterales bacterium]|nr:dihydropteroate synthase [Desulfobacterales bacterium]
MFEVIGERINTSRKLVRQAVADRDADYIIDDVKKQQEAGAHYIDVNAGARIGHEMDDMNWLLDTIQPIATVPLALDSPDPAVLEMAYKKVEKTPMVNSISLEKERYDAMMPFLAGKDCRIIALCMDDNGMPTSADDIVGRAFTLIEELGKAGLSEDRVYVDPLIQPISTDVKNGLLVYDAVRTIKTKYPKVHITGGLSNISYGLPERRIVNRTFVSLMVGAGMDSAIMDPLDAKIMATIKTADMLVGNDPFCAGFMKGVRAGAIAS